MEDMVREGNRALLLQQHGKQWLQKIFTAIDLANPVSQTWEDFSLIEIDAGVGDGFKAAQQSWSSCSEVTGRVSTGLWFGCVLHTGKSRSNSARQDHMSALMAAAQRETIGHHRKLRRVSTDTAPRLEEIDNRKQCLARCQIR